MAEVSPAIAERARKNTSAILRGLASVGQVRVAEHLNLSESTVSRMKDGELDRLGALLAACGLKVVPQDAQTVDQELLRSLSILAARGAHNVAAPSGFMDNV